MSVRRSACGAGSSLFSRSRASTKASIGLRTQGESPFGTLSFGTLSFGTGGRTSGSSDHHCVSMTFLLESVSPSGQAAPAAIQRRIASTSPAAKAGASFGISGLSPEMYSTSKLSSGLPGTIAGPLSPPASASRRRSARNLPWACSLVAIQAMSFEHRRHRLAEQLATGRGAGGNLVARDGVAGNGVAGNGAADKRTAQGEQQHETGVNQGNTLRHQALILGRSEGRPAGQNSESSPARDPT